MLHPHTNLPLYQRALSPFEVKRLREELSIWVPPAADERTHAAITEPRPAFWCFWQQGEQPFQVLVEVANVRGLDFACEQMARTARLVRESPSHFVERFLSRLAPGNASGVAVVGHMLIRHVGIFPEGKRPPVLKPIERT